jgi:hypothetical protein
MKTNLTGLRKPTAQEKERGAEIVFIRHDSDGKEFVILGAVSRESWEEWIVQTEILFENVEDIQEWRNRIL